MRETKMEFTQAIKREHERLSDMIDKLAGSSETALKRRERLAGQIAAMLQEHSAKEESALYPALAAHREAHDGIDDFLAGARAAHAELARIAVELDGMPKDDEAFAAKANELKQAAQQHMREEERLLVPLRRALGEEENEALDRALSGREARGAQLDLEGDAAQGREPILAASRQLGRRAAEQAERGRETVMAAAEIYGETAQITVQDMQAVATCSSIAAGGLGELRQAWMEWFGRNLRAGARASQEMLRCTTIEQLAEIQRNFLKESLDSLLEGGAQMLRISSRISEDAARPIEDRVLQLRSERRESRSRRSA
jgi:iron-sulfur cluster repair protein YtfE (RIC family)